MIGSVYVGAHRGLSEKVAFEQIFMKWEGGVNGRNSVPDGGNGVGAGRGGACIGEDSPTAQTVLA